MGWGEVYRAHDSRLQRTVAIKILAPRLATPDRLERFEQEARAASALNHPNILTIHDVGRQGDTAYFSMEWVDGRTLRDELGAGPVPHRRTIHLAQQIAEGLAVAHAAGIVHRDLKPENVMVRSDGLAKIVDFGLAKLKAGDAAPTVTRVGISDTGVVMGTVGYMSPEQASGRPVDYKSDQFALGLLIYESVTRKRPFERATTAQTLAATIETEPASLESLRPDVPPHLAAIVRRLLAKNPDERYESTRDLARELRSILETTASPTLVATTRKRRASVRYAAVLAAIVLVAGAALAAWLWRAPERAAPADAERPLLAVRPFRSLSPDSQQAYFADGMTEEIRGQLSQIAALRLLSRDGLDAYKDDATRAVRDLGLRHLVDGSVRVDGNRVRVSAELVDASTQQTLWSEQYDRNLADMLTVQSQIAQQIARALHATLSPAEQLRIEKRPTDNLDAYALFLQTLRASYTDRSRNLTAIEQLRKALELDPQFALARGHLAYRLMFMANYDGASYLDQAIAEAEATVRMAPSLSYGYFALGTASGRKGLGAQSRQAYLRALELDPNNTDAMADFKNEEIRRGRLDEAAYWGRRRFLQSGKTANDFFHSDLPADPLEGGCGDPSAAGGGGANDTVLFAHSANAGVARSVRRADRSRVEACRCGHRPYAEQRGGQVLPCRHRVSARRARSGALARAADGALGIEPRLGRRVASPEIRVPAAQARRGGERVGARRRSRPDRESGAGSAARHDRAARRTRGRVRDAAGHDRRTRVAPTCARRRLPRLRLSSSAIRS